MEGNLMALVNTYARSTWLTLVVILVIWAGAHDSAQGAAVDGRPAVLVCSSHGAGSRYVDLTWLKELKEKGFEPDYLEDGAEFTWDRIRNYNVLILYGTPPDETRGRSHVWGAEAPERERFIELVERYLEAGGGVFYFAHTRNADWHSHPLLSKWDARFPWAYYREKDESKTSWMPRMRGRARIAMTEQIQNTPISDGVERLWFPVSREGNSTRTGPLRVGDAWQVVAKGSPTSMMEPVDPDDLGHRTPRHPSPFVVEKKQASPPLAAIREYKNGRLFLACQSPQFSIGQGTKWLYQRVCLSRGVKGQPSHTGKLVVNALRWLAESSVNADALGGFRTSNSRLTPTNLRPGTREHFDRRWAADQQAPPAQGTLYRGMIGARSRLSTGMSSVKAIAQAARDAGLDWLVFTEAFAALSEGELRELERQCRARSSEDLTLIPGYSIATNTNNHMFFYGYALPWPEPYCLTGEDGNLLNLQYQNDKGDYVKNSKVWGTWLMKQHNRKNPDAPLHNMGYFDFTDPTGLELPDARGYSVGAIRLFRAGELVEDRTESYLMTAAGTIPPMPVSVNIMKSAEALRREVEAGHGMNYARARSLDTLMVDALDYANTFTAPNVFTSNGPKIQSWPGLERTMAFGAERFVPGHNLMRARLHVTSDVGMDTVTIYNGARVFRRFQCNGGEVFNEVLHLPSNVQRALVVVARDVDGGKAVSYSRRSWKFARNVRVSFCGDRQNECSSAPRLSKGPGNFLTHRVPEMSTSVAGVTWDGGPKGLQPSVVFHKATPIIKSSAGTEGHRYFNNLPILESGDEQATVVRSVLDEIYAPKIPRRALSHWPAASFGPIVSSKLIKSVRRFVQYNRPAIRVQELRKPHWAVRSGAYVTAYENKITFKQSQRVRQLRLFSSGPPRETPLMVSYEAEDGTVTRKVSGRWNQLDVRLRKGDWVGFHCPKTTNDVLYINRGDPVRVVKGTPGGPSTWVRVIGDLQAQTVDKGETRQYALLSVTDPLDVPERGAARFKRILDYLREPSGLEVRRGTRREAVGFTDVSAVDGVAELRIPQPETRVELTVPMRIHGLNSNWSAGVYQIDGHTAGYYTDGEGVYSPIGFDLDEVARAALFPDQHENTHVVVGHPVVASDERLKLTAMPRPAEGANARYRWHVAVNNPTDQTITATFERRMDVPGLEMEKQEHSIAPGGYQVLVE